MTTTETETSSAASQYRYSATTGWGGRRKEAQVRRYFDRVLPHLAAGSRIVEIGPGRGEFAREALARGHSYTGLEPSEELREGLLARGIDVVAGAVPPIPLDDASVDLIHSSNVYEHFVDYREALDVTTEAFRVLRPGGWLSIEAPNLDTIKWLFWYYEYQHSFPTNAGRLAALVRDGGFEPWRVRAGLTGLADGPFRIVDRLIANMALPVSRNAIVRGVLSAVGNGMLLYRIHKVLYDQVVLIARKPLHFSR